MPWRPGQSGNPRGRPRKGKSLTEILERCGRERDPESGRPRYELLAEKLWQLALDGHLEAVKLLYNRVDGLPRMQLPLGTRAGITFVITAPPGVHEPDIIDVQPAPDIVEGQARELPAPRTADNFFPDASSEDPTQTQQGGA